MLFTDRQIDRRYKRNSSIELLRIFARMAGELLCDIVCITYVCSTLYQSIDD